MRELKEKSLPLAIGLNLVLPGIGYIYMGKPIVGIFALILIVAIFIITPAIAGFMVWASLNIIMAIDMMVLNKKRTKQILEQTTIKCPKCAELIKKEAKVCRYCGLEISPQ